MSLNKSGPKNLRGSLEGRRGEKRKDVIELYSICIEMLGGRDVA